MSNDKLAHRIRVAVDCYHAATERLNELLQELCHEAEKQAGPVAIQASAVEAELTDEQIDNRTAHLFNGGQLVHRDYRISVVRAALSKPSV